jgi:nicotinamide mononucleotide adenylyltransferase
VRNPFSAKESKEMIHVYLSPSYKNYSFMAIPDFAHIPKYNDGKRWVEEVLRKYKELDAFISGDDYVRELLKPHYKIIHPGEIIPKEKQFMLRGTTVRIEMAKGGDDWKLYVPKAVSAYLEKNGVVTRFRQEYGLETLTLMDTDHHAPEDTEQEKNHTLEA